jgi:hypothetical protein
MLLASLLFAATIQTAHAGGTTAGGGNVQLPDQVQVSTLVGAVQMSKPVLTSWLSSRSQYHFLLKNHKGCGGPYQDKICLWGPKLFDRSPDIFAVLEKTSIETKLDGPCLDFGGKPNDGSMYGKVPGSICISIPNIKTKLRADNFESQIAALVIHEMSHLLGTTEPEADEVQSSILNRDLAYIPVAKIKQNAYFAAFEIQHLNEFMNQWANAVSQKTSLDGTCLQIDDVYKRNYDFPGTVNDSHFNFFTPAQNRQYASASIKMFAVREYMCGHDMKKDPRLREMARKYYLSRFGAKSRISVAEYSGLSPEEFNPDIFINKITSRQILASEAQGAAQIFTGITTWYLNDFMHSVFKTYPPVSRN